MATQQKGKCSACGNLCDRIVAIVLSSPSEKSLERLEGATESTSIFLTRNGNIIDVSVRLNNHLHHEVSFSFGSGDAGRGVVVA